MITSRDGGGSDAATPDRSRIWTNGTWHGSSGLRPNGSAVQHASPSRITTIADEGTGRPGNRPTSNRDRSRAHRDAALNAPDRGLTNDGSDQDHAERHAVAHREW